MIQSNPLALDAHILVRLDANHQIGLAHAIRVSAVLNMLAVPHHVTIAGTGDLIADFFPDQHIVALTSEDSGSFFSLVDDIRPALILVDHPRPGRDFWRLLASHARGIPVVAIDDEGGAVDADLILNGTVLEQYHHYPQASSQAMFKLGGAYTLIRPIFGATPWSDPKELSVVIVVGSGDRASHWALKLMSGNMDLRPWGAVKMIVGKAFPCMAPLQQACDAQGVLLDSGLSGEQMAKALSHSSLALITGGMIVYEAIAVGVPAVVFPQIENLIPEAMWFSQRGCIVDLGYEGGMDSSFVAQSVVRLLASPAQRMAMSKRQRTIIDGRGMSRAASAIDKLLPGGTNSVGEFGTETSGSKK